MIFRCPKCKFYAARIITTIEVVINGLGNPITSRNEISWDYSSKATCRDCKFEGTLGDFDKEVQ